MSPSCHSFLIIIPRAVIRPVNSRNEFISRLSGWKITLHLGNQSGSGLSSVQSEWEWSHVWAKWEWPQQCAIGVGVVSCLGKVGVTSAVCNRSGSDLMYGQSGSDLSSVQSEWE